MMQIQRPNKLAFEIFDNDNTANVTIIRNGISSIKTVSINDIIARLASNYRFSTGLVPKNTRLFSGTRDKYTIVLETEARVRSVSINKEGSWDSKIPFPPCLFVFNVKEELIKDAYLFSLRTANVFLTDQLYCFPLGNVYIEDGKICWGEVALPKITKPTDLTSVITLFFDSRFNGDLADGYIPMSNVNSFNSLVNNLKDKNIFPDNLLKNRNENFETMIKRVGDKNEAT